MTKRRNILIFKGVAAATDSAAVSRLLAHIPDAGKLYSLIRTRFTETRYDPRTQRDYWIGGDDEYVVCLMITGVAGDEVTRIRGLFDQPGRESIDLQDLVSHTAHVTGGAVHLMN
jgi:hypothetical protein